jgi:V-type H+-transporting ATPase subunit D
MSSGGQRPAANRMMLQQFKGRLGGAKKGHGLLKKKRDALKKKFQDMLKKIVDTKLEVGTSLKEAAFSYAKAAWATGGEDMSMTVLERAKVPSITCKLTADNVAGVKLPVFRMCHDPKKDSEVQTLGVAHGGAVIQSCRETYFRAISAVIELASLQTTFFTLNEEIKMTGRRVNALEYVIIPRIQEVMKYIEQEMDEQAREEFFRVKKVVEKKKKKLAAEKAIEDAHRAAQGGGASASAAQPVQSALQSAEAKDDDLVY